MERGKVMFSKEVLKDIEVIAKYRGMKTSAFVEQLEETLVAVIQRRRNYITREAEGQWVMGKISEVELKKFTGNSVSKPLLERKKAHKRDSKLYRENARKALCHVVKD
ncbi:MAG TPA: hypothetical protein DER04_02410 [Holosporales bacterium]|nr:hypothetical protein [Holosporales bacterium]